MSRTVLEVFLSSTADLKPYRDAIHARLARVEFFRCIRQEEFGTQNAGAVQYCCDKAKAADLFVGIIGLRRGWEPSGDHAQRSITEMEYDSARDAGRARYLWVSPDDFSVPGNLREGDAEHQRQLAFRKRVMAGGERIVSQKGFESLEALAADITEQLLAHVVTGDLIKLLRPELDHAGIAPAEDQKPAIVAAVEKLAEDKDVDLLALAKNPQGVTFADLEAKLTARAQSHEKTSAEYWRHIGALAFGHNTQKALAAYQKAVLLDPEDSDALRFLGELQYRLGDLPTAHDTFRALVRLGQRKKDKRAESLGCMRTGWIHQSRGELAEAESVTTKALQLAEAAGWTDGMARAYGNLGLIHRARGELDKAEEMHRKGLALDKELGSKEGMAAAYSNLGIVHEKRGELDKAEDMQRRGLALHEELDSPEGMAAAYSNLGIIHLTRGEPDKAAEMQRQALKLHEESGRKEGMARAYRNLAVIHAHQENQAGLCECLRKERSLWLEMGLKDKAAEAERFLKRAGCPDA